MLLFLTIWNLSSAVTRKCGRVVLFLTSVYFAISQLILLFSYSFYIRCIILANVHFHNQKQVLLIKWAFFEARKYGHIHKRPHNFVKFIKLKTYKFSRIPLNCCVRKLSRRYWWNNFGLKKEKWKREKRRNRKKNIA